MLEMEKKEREQQTEIAHLMEVAQTSHDAISMLEKAMSQMREDKDRAQQVGALCVLCACVCTSMCVHCACVHCTCTVYVRALCVRALCVRALCVRALSVCACVYARVY
jgi:hypothetical protein